MWKPFFYLNFYPIKRPNFFSPSHTTRKTSSYLTPSCHFNHKALASKTQNILLTQTRTSYSRVTAPPRGLYLSITRSHARAHAGAHTGTLRACVSALSLHACTRAKEKVYQRVRTRAHERTEPHARACARRTERTCPGARVLEENAGAHHRSSLLKVFPFLLTVSPRLPDS